MSDQSLVARRQRQALAVAAVGVGAAGVAAGSGQLEAAVLFIAAGLAGGVAGITDKTENE